MTIYLQHFTPENRTNTNELLEFLDRPDGGRVVVCFGLSYFGRPCGFATLMMYSANYLGVVDYVAIAPNARGYGAFFALCELIADFLERRTYVLNYVVAEIILANRLLATGVTPLNLIRLMRFVGFRVANIPYFAPDPAMVTDKKSCRAALMILAQPDKSVMTYQELIPLLKTIYFKHYRAWYRRVMHGEQFAAYESSINRS